MKQKIFTLTQHRNLVFAWCCVLTLLLSACNATQAPSSTPTRPVNLAGTKPAYPVLIPQIGQQPASGQGATAYPSKRVTSPTAPALPAAPKTFSLDLLQNLEYNLPDLPDGKARLQNGAFSVKGQAGSTAETTVRLTNRAGGDLDGNDIEDAVAILVLNTGGSGSFYSLAAVLNEPGGPRHAATANLGDRVMVKSVMISGGIVRLDLVTHAPSDPLCCPSQNVTKQFRLKGATLEEIK